MPGLEAFVKTGLYDSEEDVVHGALRHLLRARPEQRIRLAVHRYQTEAIPFDQSANPAHGFDYKKVPHITLKSIAQNVALDAIVAKHQSILDEKVAALNAALHAVTPELRQRLAAKLLERQKHEAKKLPPTPIDVGGNSQKTAGRNGKSPSTPTRSGLPN